MLQEGRTGAAGAAQADGEAGQAAAQPARPDAGRPGRAHEGPPPIRVHGRGGAREVRAPPPAAAGADAQPDVPGPQAVDPVNVEGGPGPGQGDGAGPEPDAGAAPAGPRHVGLVPRLHAEVRADVPARDRDAGPAPGAPAAPDGADAVAHAVALAAGPRRAAADDGRAAPGRLAPAGAGPPGRDDAAAHAAVRADRALPVLRRRAAQPP